MDVEVLLAHADGFPVVDFMAQHRHKPERGQRSVGARSVTRRGRNAALPDPDIRTEHGLLPDGLGVRCFAQGSKEVRNFDFAALPAATGVQRGLAAAFARRTAPGGGLNRIESMRSSYRAARLFCEYLATLPGAPVEVSDLAPSHIDGFLQYRRDAAGSVSENCAS